MRIAIPVSTPGDPNPLPLMIAAFCLLWSSAFAVAKLALADCPPLLLLTARFLLAGGLMLTVAAVDRTPWRIARRDIVVLAVIGIANNALLLLTARFLLAGGLMLTVAAVDRTPWRIARRDIVVLAVIGIANNALYLGLNYIGMRSISAGLSALIVSANPVLTVVLAAMFLDERMTWRKVAGLLIGIGGVGFIVKSRITDGIDDPIGIAFTVAALVSLVTGTILFKRLTPNGGLWIGNSVQNLAGGLALAPFAFGFEAVGEIVPSWRLIGAVAYLALLVSVCGYLLWLHLLTVSSATTASAYYFLMPPLGMLFGWLLLGERIAWSDLIGILPVALGIYLVTRAGKLPPRKIAPNQKAAPSVPDGVSQVVKDVCWGRPITISWRLRRCRLTQSRLNTTEANQPVATAISAVARP
jgi:drug/metabolite transporter (DMT)-like permease